MGNTNKEIKAGDVVQLKSGGPKMTIKEYGTYGMPEKTGYLCVWFEENVACEGVYEEILLEAVNTQNSICSVPIRRG